MEAKDTVMNSQDIKELKSKRWGEPARNYDYTIEELMVAEAQAEITGKIMYQAGIREVVGWIQKWSHLKVDSENLYLVMDESWHAKLKEWGVENG